MIIRAGNLDRQITLQRASTTVDAAGTPQTTWSVLAELRAQVIQQSSDQFIREGGGADANNTIIFRTWFFDGVRLDDRVIYQGNVYELKEKKEIGRRRGLELRCLAKGDDNART